MIQTCFSFRELLLVAPNDILAYFGFCSHSDKKDAVVLHLSWHFLLIPCVQTSYWIFQLYFQVCTLYERARMEVNVLLPPQTCCRAVWWESGPATENTDTARVCQDSRQGRVPGETVQDSGAADGRILRWAVLIDDQVDQQVLQKFQGIPSLCVCLWESLGEEKQLFIVILVKLWSKASFVHRTCHTCR